MVRYAAQVGYLATKVKDREETRAVELGLEYPEPPDGSYLVQIIIDLGWCGNSEFGLKPLLWSEIKAYADLTGMLGQPWEAKCVHDMSVEYCIERNNNDALRIAPYDRVNKDD